MKYVALLPLVGLVSCTALSRPDARATLDPWSRFRGPNGSGYADVTGLPDHLSKDGDDANVLWRVPFPPGHSSPVLSAEHVFVTAFDDGTLWTYCLERETGMALWGRQAPRPRVDALDNRNNPASPSPVVDGDVVVVFFPEFGMLAYDHEGNELWRTELGPFSNLYGMGASPILYDDLVLLACDQSMGSYLLAVDKATGEERWRVARPEAKSGHCTPILVDAADGVTEVLLPGSFYLTAYDARTGAERWRASGLCFEMKSVPVVDGDLVFINGYGSPMNDPGNQVRLPAFDEVIAENDADGDGRISNEEMPASRATDWFDFVDLDTDGLLDAKDWGYLQDALASQNGMLAFRMGGAGELGDDALVWSYRRSVPQLPSPLVCDGALYMLNDQGGILVTFDPESGEVIEQGRVPDAADAFYASPVGGDGKVFLVSEHGTVAVLPGGGSLEPLSVTDLGERVYATPALADGRVFLRTEDALYCFGQRD